MLLFTWGLLPTHPCSKLEQLCNTVFSPCCLIGWDPNAVTIATRGITGGVYFQKFTSSFDVIPFYYKTVLTFHLCLVDGNCVSRSSTLGACLDTVNNKNTIYRYIFEIETFICFDSIRKHIWASSGNITYIPYAKYKSLIKDDEKSGKMVTQGRIIACPDCRALFLLECGRNIV